MSIQELYALVYFNKYVQALILLVGFFTMSKLVIYISQKYLAKITAKTNTKVDDLILEATTRPISLLIILFGLKIAMVPLSLISKVNILIQNSISSIIVLIVTFLFMKVFMILINHWGTSWATKTKSTIDDQLINLLHRFSKILFSFIGILLILDLWGIKVGPLLASLGIAGIAVAFALQTTLGNIFGGISLIVDKSIKVGDVVELDVDTKGTVLDVGLRSTKIKTFNNEVIILPNGKLADSKIINYVLPEQSARLVVPFSVAYGSNIQRVKDLIIGEVHSIDGVLKDPAPVVRFLEMANSSLNFSAYIWCETYAQRFAIRDVANTNIYNALNKAKISIPFPQMDVHVKK